MFFRGEMQVTLTSPACRPIISSIPANKMNPSTRLAVDRYEPLVASRILVHSPRESEGKGKLSLPFSAILGVGGNKGVVGSCCELGGAESRPSLGIGESWPAG